MKPFKKTKRTCLPVVLALILPTGCADLSFTQPKPETTRFYHLEMVPGDFPVAGDLSVLIGSSSVARYLDQPQIVTFPEPNVLDYSNDHRWAEPLVNTIDRYLLSTLAHGLETSRVGLLREMGGDQWDFRLGYHVHQLGGQPGEEVYLQVSWWLTPKDRPPSRFENARYASPVTGMNYEAYVEAIRSSLDLWSRDVVSAIQESGDPEEDSSGPE